MRISTSYTLQPNHQPMMAPGLVAQGRPCPGHGGGDGQREAGHLQRAAGCASLRRSRARGGRTSSASQHSSARALCGGQGGSVGMRGSGPFLALAAIWPPLGRVDGDEVAVLADGREGRPSRSRRLRSLASGGQPWCRCRGPCSPGSAGTRGGRCGRRRRWPARRSHGAGLAAVAVLLALEAEPAEGAGHGQRRAERADVFAVGPLDERSTRQHGGAHEQAVGPGAVGDADQEGGLEGLDLGSFSAAMENIDTASRPKKIAYLSHFRRSCQRRGSWVWKRPRADRGRSCRCASCSEPNGHIQPQNRPRPNRKTVTMMKIQNRKMNGSDRNSDQVHWNSSEWNQVSTWVMEGCAIRPKPIQKMLTGPAVYLKAVDRPFVLVRGQPREPPRGRRRPRRRRPAAGEQRDGRQRLGLPDAHPGRGGLLDLRAPALQQFGGQPVLARTRRRLRCPVARSTRLPRKASFHG